MKKIPMLKGYDYRKEDFVKANLNGDLVRVGLNINCRICNLNCPYCFIEGGKLQESNKELINKEVASVEEVKNWIIQAEELNTKTIVIDGNYEPLTNREDLINIIDCIYHLGIQVILITNMLLLDEELVQILNKYKVSILGKLNVPIVMENHKKYKEYAYIQSYLTGGKINNVYQKLQDKINMLINAGFAKEETNGDFVTTRLGIETVIVRENYPYIQELYMQMIKKNIYVHAERVKPQGAASDSQFYITADKIKTLNEKLKEECEKEGYETCVTNPVYLQNRCLNHMATININIYGEVIPCPSVDLIVGNLKKETMRSILNNKYMNILRNLPQYIAEPCKSCTLLKNLDCYGGCRGFVFSKMLLEKKDILSALTEADISCWRAN